MGGFGGSRVSAQPVRAGGHCAGHGRLRYFVFAGPARPPGNRAVTRRRGGAAASLAREAKGVYCLVPLWQILGAGAPRRPTI